MDYSFKPTHKENIQHPRCQDLPEKAMGIKSHPIPTFLLLPWPYTIHQNGCFLYQTSTNSSWTTLHIIAKIPKDGKTLSDTTCHLTTVLSKYLVALIDQEKELSGHFIQRPLPCSKMVHCFAEEKDSNLEVVIGIHLKRN